MNNLDVVATIVALAGASPGVALDGRSLVPLIADAGAPWRNALLIQSPVNRFQAPAERFTAIRTATRKYVKYDSGRERLYDLASDLSSTAADPRFERLEIKPFLVYRYGDFRPQPVLWGGGSMDPAYRVTFYWNLLALMLVAAVMVMVRLRQEETQREIDSLRRYAHAM